MYHSSESGHLDLTLDLRQLGVTWTLHCWMTSLSTATDLHLDSVMDNLLQDFLSAWPDDYSSQFVDECLPLLFNIFRYTKVSLHYAIPPPFFTLNPNYIMNLDLCITERRNDLTPRRHIFNMLRMGGNVSD